MALALKHHEDDTAIDVHTAGGTPIRYLPLDHVYSATSPCCVSVSVSASGSSNVMSKKVKARKLIVDDFDNDPNSKPSLPPHRPPLIHVYSRRPKRFHHSSLGRLLNKKKKKKRRFGSSELVKLGVDSSVLRSLDGPRLRDSRIHNNSNVSNSNLRKRRRNSSQNCDSVLPDSPSTKRWVRLSFDSVDPKTFFGLQCKVYWPLDADWYSGQVVGYNPEANRHHVEYEDGDKEELILSNEKLNSIFLMKRCSV
ncbi:hypothetical protein SLA2020_380850 [Shorea laevis]